MCHMIYYSVDICELTYLPMGYSHDSFRYRGSKQKHNFVTQNCYNVLDKVIQHVFVHVCLVVHMNSMQWMELFD